MLRESYRACKSADLELPGFTYWYFKSVGPGGLALAGLVLAALALRIVRVARSASFEDRVHIELRRQGIPAAGPVVLFVVDTASASEFYGNFTFVQGHIAFHPETSNPAQFGMLNGELGELRVGEPALGYAVLPVHVDLAQSLDIYWNDVQITATLRP